MAGQKMARLMLEGVQSLEQAEALKGAIVMAAEEDLPPPGENQFYYREAVGCEAVLTDGRVIGKIEEVFYTGANDVFVVRGEGKEILVPVIAQVVKQTDFANKRIIIESVPGLLD